MPKVTLDMNTFKALASDTRLDILRALDGKKMCLKDICKETKLNKATLHEHLNKLNDAGLVKKKEREGHKWVYYKLTWKGEGLLHPENTRIVVLFSATFVAIAVGIIQMVNYIRGTLVAKAVNVVGSESTLLYRLKDEGERFLTFDESFSKGSSGDIAQAPISIPSVSLVNQTQSELSQAVVCKLDVRGIADNAIHVGDVEWRYASYNVFGRLNETKRFVVDSFEEYGGSDGDLGAALPDGVGNVAADGASNVPSHMLAYVHDPALQWIAVACIIVAGILLSFGIWRYWKNRKPQL